MSSGVYEYEAVEYMSIKYWSMEYWSMKYWSDGMMEKFGHRFIGSFDELTV
jgi:hypothetical protein